MPTQRAPFRLILLILGAVLFFLSAVIWWAAPEREPSYRMRLIGAGLFCWSLSTLDW